MIENSTAAEKAAVMNAARSMCAAARTAPKTRGIDHIKACIITGEEKDALAAEMDRLSGILDYGFFVRDAICVRSSEAVVLIGTTFDTRKLQEGCAYCNFENCTDCTDKNGVCVYDPMDLGIAVGSAVSVAADARIDNRIMFSAGKAALSLGYMDHDVKIAMAVPLSATGKSPFFDRKS
jgi:uncharacterized ferredoxin-like protein